VFGVNNPFLFSDRPFGRLVCFQAPAPTPSALFWLVGGGAADLVSSARLRWAASFDRSRSGQGILITRGCRLLPEWRCSAAFISSRREKKPCVLFFIFFSFSIFLFFFIFSSRLTLSEFLPSSSILLGAAPSGLLWPAGKFLIHSCFPRFSAGPSVFQRALGPAFVSTSQSSSRYVFFDILQNRARRGGGRANQLTGHRSDKTVFLSFAVSSGRIQAVGCLFFPGYRQRSQV